MTRTVEPKPRISAKPAPFSSVGEQVLAHAQSGREIIQDFCPLSESLEWDLGQEYLRQRGNKAFISDSSPVPFVVNNDGTLSQNAAEILFASLEASGQCSAGSGQKEEILVLELGIGVGLFARFFLDHFRDLCRKNKRDYYDRLTYIAADRSERMLLDVCRHGILSNHPGHYRTRTADAVNPETLFADLAIAQQGPKPFRAVFLNYLLDCLPAAVLEMRDEKDTDQDSGVTEQDSAADKPVFGERKGDAANTVRHALCLKRSF
jgi:hypothetical protein